MTEKKSNQPELIEDEALDEASGGNLTIQAKYASDPTMQKVQPTAAWPSKIEIGSLKAGDGSV
jgi:hypothetical protein